MTLKCNNFLHYFRHHYRFHAVLLRERFDEKKDIKDMRVARKWLQQGEEELFLKQHPQPFTCKLTTVKVIVLIGHLRNME